MRTQLTSRTTVLTTLALLFICLGPVRTALGGVIVFNDEPAFFQATNIVSTETFDEFLTPTTLGTGAVVTDGITYTSGEPASRWIAGIQVHQVFPRFVSPPNDFGTDLIGSNVLTFGEGRATDAIGFFILTAGVTMTYQISVTTAGGEQLNEPLVGEFQPAFRGFIAPEGITSVTVTHISPLSRINFSFDNVSRGSILPISGHVVSEPSTYLLFGTCLLGILGHVWLGRNRVPKTKKRVA